MRVGGQTTERHRCETCAEIAYPIGTLLFEKMTETHKQQVISFAAARGRTPNPEESRGLLKQAISAAARRH
jgi:hypothetical protein